MYMYCVQQIQSTYSVIESRAIKLCCQERDLIRWTSAEFRYNVCRRCADVNDGFAIAITCPVGSVELKNITVSLNRHRIQFSRAHLAPSMINCAIHSQPRNLQMEVSMNHTMKRRFGFRTFFLYTDFSSPKTSPAFSPRTFSPGLFPMTINFLVP